MAKENIKVNFVADEASVRKPYSQAPEIKDPLFAESTNEKADIRKPYEREKVEEETPADLMRKAFERNRKDALELHKLGQFQDLARFRSAIAGSLSGVVDAIEEELTTLNARKELLEEELYKYKAAADLMLKQMTYEQN